VTERIVYGSHAEEEFELLKNHGFPVSNSKFEKRCENRKSLKRAIEDEKSRNEEFPSNMF
jgi:hypothetical protein